MTREQTIMWLDSLKKDIGQSQHQELWHYAEALDVAIELLSTKAKTKCVAQIKVDTEEVVSRIKEEYDITDGWIPCSERVPKENEYVDNVCKYYLIQDEYGDMHVAHLSGRGWETIESIKALGCDVIAWMPLPEPYREDGEEWKI